jgi:hypothetical protein
MSALLDDAAERLARALWEELAAAALPVSSLQILGHWIDTACWEDLPPAVRRLLTAATAAALVRLQARGF